MSARYTISVDYALRDGEQSTALLVSLDGKGRIKVLAEQRGPNPVSRLLEQPRVRKLRRHIERVVWEE